MRLSEFSNNIFHSRQKFYNFDLQQTRFAASAKKSIPLKNPHNVLINQNKESLALIAVKKRARREGQTRKYEPKWRYAASRARINLPVGATRGNHASVTVSRAGALTESLTENRASEPAALSGEDRVNATLIH